MSFFGKKFKRTKAEGLEKLMEALKVDEKMRSVAKTNGSSYNIFLKNDDGTYTFAIYTDDKEAIKHTFKMGEESDFKRPDGAVMHSKFQLDGETLTQYLTDPEGRHLTFLREYNSSDRSAKLTITVAELDVSATMHFQEM